jgi:hypothetical protein
MFKVSPCSSGCVLEGTGCISKYQPSWWAETSGLVALAGNRTVLATGLCNVANIHTYISGLWTEPGVWGCGCCLVLTHEFTLESQLGGPGAAASSTSTHPSLVIWRPTLVGST